MSRPPITHDLKCWPEFFEKLLAGSKNFEARRNDRDFQPGDTLRLREWEPEDNIHSSRGRYTGRVLERVVGYVLHGKECDTQTGLAEGYCVMAVRPSGGCEWSQDHFDGSWDTACEGKFIFGDGGPMANQFKFCPYCGRPVTEAKGGDHE